MKLNEGGVEQRGARAREIADEILEKGWKEWLLRAAGSWQDVRRNAYEGKIASKKWEKWAEGKGTVLYEMWNRLHQLGVVFEGEDGRLWPTALGQDVLSILEKNRLREVSTFQNMAEKVRSLVRDLRDRWSHSQ